MRRRMGTYFYDPDDQPNSSSLQHYTTVPTCWLRAITAGGSTRSATPGEMIGPKSKRVTAQKGDDAATLHRVEARLWKRANTRSTPGS